MENASQALIIAGAILLAILLVAVGMFVFNNANNAIQRGATQMSREEINTHNSYFDAYQGMQNGATVKGFLAGWGQRVAPEDTADERKPLLEGDLGSGKNADQILNAQAKVKTAQRYNVDINHNAQGLVDKVTIKSAK